MKSEWHYPRQAFADRVYTLLVDSPTSAISLFGPRRTGKTEFLREDLAPLAQRKRHRVVYVSLWQSVEVPIASLLHAFDDALRGGSITDRMAAATRALAPRLRLSPPGTGAEIEIDVSELRGRPQDDHLLLLDQYLERLSKESRPTLLLFDEFQELASQDDTAPIIAALRTSLDTRRRGLVSVFTGSSQDGLRQMFSAKEAPFYRFATQMTLPTLDAAFVDHQLRVFEAKAKRKLIRKDALSVFETVERNPLFFQQWLIAMMAYTSLTPQSAIDHVLRELGEQFGYEDVWHQLNGLQRSLMRLLAEQTNQIYAEASTRRMAELMSAEPPPNAKVQSAVRRLSRLKLAEKWDDVWRLNDPLLEVWVKGRPDTEYRQTK